MYRILLSELAKCDLKNIKQYISQELNSPASANKILKKITNRIRQLAENPLMGAGLNNIVSLNTSYRYLVCDNYLAFYKVTNDAVQVDRVLYARRDYLRILFPNTSEST